MSTSTENVITAVTHGKLANQIVLRQRFGKTILAKRPRKPVNGPTQAQTDHRRRFTGAVNYARSVMNDPVLRAVYEPRAVNGRTIFMIAVGDYLKLPWIDQINATGYSGHTGDKIRVVPADNVKVTAVTVMINDASGLELESGGAVIDSNGTEWVYTATTDQLPITGTKIIVAVRDLPGHTAESELVL
ncbi:MAG: hypothetical protein NTY96_07305 [Bacteroidetes bacterium]|nr:hypothetical protein [Bacteroidota bacterium]